MIYIAHEHPLKGHPENQWRHVISHWKDVEVVQYEDIPNVPTVLLAPENGYVVSGEISLFDFEHPENVCYIFGPDHVHFQPHMLKKSPDFKVFVPLGGYKEMYSWVCAGIVLYDRSLKNG